MKIASITETKNNLSQLLDLVRHGETVVVTDRNIPIAHLTPVPAGAAGASDAMLDKLERNGLVRRGKGVAGLREIIETAPPKASSSVLAALLEERDEGR